MSPKDFVDGIRDTSPMTRSLVEEHIEDNFGEVLLHLLVADVRQLALASFESGDAAMVTSLLDQVDLALRTGDEQLRHAVEVSFVEDTGWWDPAMQAFIATWPPALTAEVDLQKSWRPGGQ